MEQSPNQTGRACSPIIKTNKQTGVPSFSSYKRGRKADFAITQVFPHCRKRRKRPICCRACRARLVSSDFASYFSWML